MNTPSIQAAYAVSSDDLCYGCSSIAAKIPNRSQGTYEPLLKTRNQIHGEALPRQRWGDRA